MSHDLCEELIVEIFSRLPSKSLLRFRSVSKSLCARIGSPGFIRLHAQESPNKFTLIHRILNYKGELEIKSIYTIHSEGQMSSYTDITPFEYPFISVGSIVGSCNGIVCVYEHKRDCIHLWNPSIRRKVTVHGLPPWGLELGHGFGFDPTIDDYKILRTSTAGTFVYTMKTRIWREIASAPSPSVCSYVNSPQCLFDGALHWAVGYLCSHYVTTFNLSSEVFSTTVLLEPSWETSAITIIKGCLAVACSKLDNMRICVRRKYNDTDASWSLVNTHEHKLGHMTDSSCIVDMITGIQSLELLDMGTACD